MKDRSIAVAVIIALIYVGKPVLVPLLYGLVLAMVMYPTVARLERAHMPRALAIASGLFIVFLIFSAIMGLLVWQMNAFRAELPEVRERSLGILAQVSDWFQRNARDMPMATERWQGFVDGLPQGFAGILVRIIEGLFGVVFNMFIIPVITALLLYDRRRYVQVLLELAGTPLKPVLFDVLHRSIHSFARFIAGMIQVYAIVGVLNSIGLMVLGVDHAILFGMLSALMTIIPYVGIVISALLPMSMAWVETGSIWYPMGVIAVYTAVQYLEANLIFPRIVGRRLNLNTLASIVIVLVGALIWGVSGMVLLLPCVAILNIIASDIPRMRPLHLLLGVSDPAAVVPASPPSS
ncbi:MAG: AI-2E family transporter [Flavobacteriales bacterium]